MLKKFVAILALMAMFIVTGCTGPVEGEEVSDETLGEEISGEILDEEITDEVVVEEEGELEGEESPDEIVGEELEGEQITAEDEEEISNEILPALPAIPTPVIPAVITPEIMEKTEGEEISGEILPVDVDGIVIPAVSAEVILAQCLTANGAKLYTASWCGHCQNQKAAFLDGVEYIDHTECAVDDGWAQECKDAEIESVPTWVFADETTKSGNTPLATLADRAGCIYE